MGREYKDWLVRVFGRLWEGGAEQEKELFPGGVHVAELSVGLASSLSLPFNPQASDVCPATWHSRVGACDAEKAGSGKTI